MKRIGSKITFKWDKNYRGNDILIAQKKRGKISITEIREALRGDYRYQGVWVVIIKAQEDSGYQGWGDIDEPQGDILELYRVVDDDQCPICAATFLGVTHCPQCGDLLEEGGLTHDR